LTPRILELGFSYLSSLSLYGLARPLVERLARETNELCTMSVRDADSLVYVVRAEIRTPLSRAFGVGSRLPLFATSMGRVMLAGLDDAELEGFLAKGKFQEFTRYTKTERGRIRDEVLKARRQGWCLVKQELELGVCGLSVTVHDADGHVAAAVSISMNMARFDETQTLKEYLPKLRAVAAQICSALQATRPAGRPAS
jgi:IclR family pca regulon transcriptional regulator